MSEYEGHENLEIISKSQNFNRWMYEEIVSGLKGNILEAGSGQGLFSKWVIQDFPRSEITLSEISQSYLKKLKGKFTAKNIMICELNLNNKEDFEKIGYEKFDSIFALNVLEHVKNDEFALEQLYRMLKKDGTLIVLVPCHKFLYNVIDESLGHWRRYTKKELESKLVNRGFKIEKIFSFNTIGMFGWYINGNICKNPKLSQNATKLFDKIIPIEKFLERLFGKSVGLSIIAFSKK